MKKILVAAFLLAAGLTTVNAQTAQLGIKAGINSSGFRGGDAKGSESIGDFNAGFFLHLPVTKTFSIQPELQYSGQGAKGDENGISVKTKLGYMNLPVLAKYISPGGFFAQTGPQAGVLLTAKAKAGNTAKVDVLDAFNKFDFSWVVGAGLHTKLNLDVDVRYNLGLSKLVKDSDAKVYNSVFQVGLMYTFKTSK